MVVAGLGAAVDLGLLARDHLGGEMIYQARARRVSEGSVKSQAKHCCCFLRTWETIVLGPRPNVDLRGIESGMDSLFLMSVH